MYEINLYQKLYDLVRQIPKGKITTYKALALALGDLKAIRVVGRMLNQNPDLIIPCHRVIMSNGEIGGYKLGKAKKKQLLRREGLELKDSKVIDYEKHLFTAFKTDYPLKTLRQEQIKLAHKLILEDKFDRIEKVVGVDVGYKGRVGYGGGVVLNQEFEVLEQKRVKKKIFFPYLTTYFAYCEIPVILEVIKKLESKIDLIMVNAHGIAHPRGLGAASHLGLLISKPVIGVAQKRLCGEYTEPKIREWTKLRYKGKTIGGVLLSKSGCKPIFVSPGNFISLESSLEIVKRFLGKHKLPEPLRLADLLVRNKIKEDQTRIN